VRFEARNNRMAKREKDAFWLRYPTNPLFAWVPDSDDPNPG
jgi:hypothetical protein